MARVSKRLIGLGLIGAVAAAIALYFALNLGPYPHPYQWQYGIWFRQHPVGTQQEQLQKLSDGRWHFEKISQIETAVRGQALAISEKTVLIFDAIAPYRLLSIEWHKRSNGAIEHLSVTRDEDDATRTFSGVFARNGEQQAVRTSLAYTLDDHLSLIKSIHFVSEEKELFLTELQLPELRVNSTPMRWVQQGSRLSTRPWILAAKSVKNVRELEYTFSSSAKLLGIRLGSNWRIEEQVASSETPQTQDIYWASTIGADRAVGTAREVKLLGVRWPQTQRFPLSQSAQQHLVPGYVLVDSSKPNEKVTAEDERDALIDEQKFSMDDLRLKQLAQRLTKNAESQSEKVDRILLFVSEHLKRSDVLQNLSATEILALGEGDCTEFAQLFVAMMRALDIPAREISGWVYLGDEVKRFGGHAWAEVAIDGEWVAVDPMWNMRPVSATHLRVGVGELGATLLANADTNFMFNIEQVRVQ